MGRRPEGKGETYALNMIDTPGHVDFTYEVSRSLAACEGAILLVDAAQGIEAQTLANLYLALENDLEIIPVLNKIDLPAADPEKYGRELAQLIGCDPEDVLRVSGKTGEGVEALLDRVVEKIPRADRRRERADPRDDLRLGVRQLPRRHHLRPHDRRQAAPAREDPDDVDPRDPRAARDRRELARADPDQGSRRRRGRLPDHRREGRAAVEGRRHRHHGVEAVDRGAARLHRPEADGVLGAVPDRRQRLPDPARGPRQAEAVGRLAQLRARDLGRAGLRVPLRVPRPAAPRDHHRAPRARVRARPDLDGARR